MATSEQVAVLEILQRAAKLIQKPFLIHLCDRVAVHPVDSSSKERAAADEVDEGLLIFEGLVESSLWCHSAADIILDVGLSLFTGQQSVKYILTKNPQKKNQQMLYFRKN